MRSGSSFSILPRSLSALPANYQFGLEYSERPAKTYFNGDCVHSHPFIQIWYLQAGCYHELFNSKPFVMTPGSLLVVPPFSTHFTHNPSGTLKLYTMHLTVDFLKTLLPSKSAQRFSYPLFFGENDNAVFNIRDEKRVYFDSLIDSIYQKYKENMMKSIVLGKNNLIALFEFILDNSSMCETEMSQLFSKHSDMLQRVSKYIEQHLSEKIMLDDICKMLYMSPSQFNRIFKRLVGCTLSEYIMRIRLNESCGMLTLTDLTVEEVGKQCGFPNKAHFHRQFLSLMGHTPREHRLITEDLRTLRNLDYNDYCIAHEEILRNTK